MSKVKAVAVHASTHVGLASLSVLLLAGFCFSQPTVSVSPKNGPPTSKLLVSGKGFAPYAAIDIYFDTKDEALATADGSGSFSKIAIHALASAVPGKHWVSAVQRSRRAGAQAPFLVNTNWSQFHFTPDHKGLNPYENVLNAGNVGGIGLLWNYTTGAGVPYSPAVANGIVYAGSDDGNVYALNASTGALRWSYPAVGSPAVANGLVYVDMDRYFLGLNATTGAMVWSYLTNDGVNSPATVTNGVVYLGGGSEDYAVNASNGSEVWKTHYGYADASSMAYANELVYFGTTNQLAYVLNASDGSATSCYLGSGSGYSSPAVANGVVYVGSGNGLAATNATTCASLWNFTSGGGVTSSSPAVANGVVYVGSDGGNIYALNASTGTLQWSYLTGGLVESSPAVANGVVYVGSDDGNIYALNASTGALLWSYATGGPVQSSPIVANGLVYVGSNDGNIYAFGLTGTNQAKLQADEAAACKRPDWNGLRADFSLKVPMPKATSAGPH